MHGAEVRRLLHSRLSGAGHAMQEKPFGSGGPSNKAPVSLITGPPIPLSMLPPPITWPLFTAVPAPNGHVMARNINGSGKKIDINIFFTIV